MVNNFLTFDVEEWYEAEFIQQTGYRPGAGERSQLSRQVDIFLGLCEKWEVKATCFVTGEVGRKHPQVVRKLFERGHEIASHSMEHKLIYDLDPASFRKDLKASLALLEGITGAKVRGFRAPSLSVNGKVRQWFYQILEEEGFKYSSSVYPAKNFLYGYPEADPVIHMVPGRRIVEIPQQLLDLGFTRLGFAGGAYLRLFPVWLVKSLIAKKNKAGKPVYIYAHPWELAYGKYPVKLSLAKTLIQNWGIPWNAAKISKIIGKHRESFVQMADFAKVFMERHSADNVMGRESLTVAH
jgi:peptidoglycan-N-acetylglucosamine deacetylase